MWWDGDWAWWMWLAMAVGMTVMAGVFLASLWLILRALGLRRDGALEELRDRYARCELTPDQFEERRRTLGGEGRG